MASSTIATEQYSVEPESQETRRQALRYARATLALEGFHLDDSDIVLFERYVAGEIDLAELGRLIDLKDNEEIAGA